MPASPVNCPNNTLPRELDVVVSISRPQSEIATDMTLMCLCTPDVNFPAGNNRVRYYSAMPPVTEIPASSTIYPALAAFFAQSPRPQRVAVGRIFTDPTSAVLTGGSPIMSQLKSMSDGAFIIQVDGAYYTLDSLNFTAVTTLSDVVTVMQQAIAAKGLSSVLTAGLNAGGTAVELSTVTKGTGTLGYALSSVAASGATLSGPAPTLSDLTAIANGGFDISVDGQLQKVGPISFESATTMSDVASALNLALTSVATVIVTDNNGLLVSSKSTGGGSTLTYASQPTGGEVATAGTLKGAVYTLSDVQDKTDAGFAITVNGVKHEVGPFTLVAGATADDVLTALESAVSFATVTQTDGAVSIVSNTVGAASTVSYAEAPADSSWTDVSEALKLTQAAGAVVTVGTDATMTDVSGLLCWTQATGAILAQGVDAKSVDQFAGDMLALSQPTASSLTQGYIPGDVVSELALIKAASRCNNAPIYVWALDAIYRDTAVQYSVADWAETQAPSWFTAETSSENAHDTANTTNIGYYANSKNYTRTSVYYSQMTSEYGGVSYAARMLAVNYAIPDSAITMKFKDLPGITPVQINESQLQGLTARRINCLTLIGNSSRTVREGVQSADTWYTDSLVALDNFREELQVEVYNVFLRKGKVPFTEGGQNLLVSACTRICNRYTRNGVFAPRDEESDENETGIVTRPATAIQPVSVAYSTVSERAQRLAPPILITAYEAGAMHKVSINVSVYN